MTGRTLVRLLTVAAAAALCAGTATVAHAEPGGAPVVMADLDRDRKDDRVSVVATSGGGLALEAELTSGATRYAPLPDDDGILRVGLRATDVDSDGYAEVVTPVFVGMRSTTSNVYVLGREAALVPLHTPDGQPFALTEGGGAVMVNGYSCVADHDGRELVTVEATAHQGPDDQPRYTGNLVVHLVADGTVTAVSDQPFTEVLRTDPILQYDPTTCAPTP